MMQFSKFCVDKQFSSTEQLNDSQIITIGIYPKEVWLKKKEIQNWFLILLQRFTVKAI